MQTYIHLLPTHALVHKIWQNNEKSFCTFYVLPYRKLKTHTHLFKTNISSLLFPLHGRYIILINPFPKFHSGVNANPTSKCSNFSCILSEKGVPGSHFRSLLAKSYCYRTFDRLFVQTTE